MKPSKYDKELDELITRTLGREKPTFDFSKWKETHKEEIRIFKSQTGQIPHSAQPFKIWRIIMKSRITKLAAAAVIIIAVIIGIHQLGGSLDGTSVAFAEVLEVIVVAETASFDVALSSSLGNDEPQTSHLDCMAPSKIRQTMADGNVNIADYEKHKAVILDVQNKEATVLEWVGEAKQWIASSADIFGNMQKLFEKMIRYPDESIQYLGFSDIDGIEAIGFKVKLQGHETVWGPDWQSRGSFTVWADTASKLPVKWEWYDDMFGIKTVVTNVEINGYIDESLFDLTVPEGYEEQIIMMDKGITLPEPEERASEQEQKIIEGFKNWLEVSGGKFPSSLTFEAAKDLDTEAYVIIRQVGWGFQRTVELPNKFSLIDGYDKDNPPPKEEQDKLQEKLNSAAELFTTVFHMPAECDWHYAGKDVVYGDANTPIFWFKPRWMENYSVIYGDLTVEHIPPEDLPKHVY